MEQMNVLTQEGFDKLKAELNDLVDNQRNQVAQEIKEARAQGDLSENAEYHAAKEKQSDIETRIEELTKLLKNVKIISEADVQEGVVSLGTKVTVLDIEFEEEADYVIVGSTESDPANGLISDASPMGRALLGRAEGEVVEVEAPVGVIEMKILKVSRN